MIALSFKNIKNFLSGYVLVKAEGNHPERFLNICLHRNLDIRNIHYLGEKVITAHMSIDAFKSCRQICYRTKTRLRIKERFGLPFILHRYRKRKPVVFCIVIIFAILLFSSNRIMGITVFGNKNIDTQTILNQLSVSGISLGKSTSNIDSSKIRNRMMIDIPELAWVGITVNGSRVYVEIVERLENEEIFDFETPCNLVASKDGIIESIEARDGQTMIKKGSGVREGDVLVSGIMDNENGGIRYVHAYGDVFAKTEYAAIEEYSLEYDKATNTGKSKTYFTLKILDKEFPLLIPKNKPYESFEYIENETEYRVPFDLLPSLYIKKQSYAEQIITKEKRTLAETLSLAEQELDSKLRETLPKDAEITERIVEHTLTDQGNVKVTVKFLCRENIARQAVIDIPQENLPE